MREGTSETSGRESGDEGFEAGSPFGLSRSNEYIGIDLSPAVKPLERNSLMLWGRHYEMKTRPALPLYMVERGSRKSSLDSFLYRKAREAGVKVRFGKTFETRKDFMDLPHGLSRRGNHNAESQKIPDRLGPASPPT